MSTNETTAHDAGYAAAVDDVLAAIHKVHAIAGEPTPLHKGIRMACSSIIDRVKALADETEGRKLYRQRADSLARADEAISSRKVTL